MSMKKAQNTSLLINNIPTNSKSTKKLVPQTFTLSDGRKTTVLNLLSKKFKGIFREFETFLNESSKLANTATFFTKYFLGVRRTNNDLNKIYKFG